MKLTLLQIAEMVRPQDEKSLPSVSKLLGGETTDWKTLYRLKLLKKELEAHLKNIQETQVTIFKKFSEVKDGKDVLKEDKKDKYVEEVNKFLSTEVELSFLKIDPTHIKAELNTFDFEHLEPLLDEKFLDKLAGKEPEEG
jgi:hypothetical protein